MKTLKIRKLLACISAGAVLLSGFSATTSASIPDTGNEAFYLIEADYDEAMDYGIAQDTLPEDEVYFEDTDYDSGMEQELPGEETGDYAYVNYEDDFVVIDDDPISSTVEDYVEPDYNENSDEENEDYEDPDSYEAEAEEAPDNAETEETDEGIFENGSADEVFTEESLVGDAQDAYTGNVSPDNDTNQNIQEALNEKIRVSNTVSGDSGSNDIFKFILTRAVNGAKVDEVTIKGSGNATFKSLGYRNPGTYTYRVTEKAGNAGYVYDTSVYTVRIVITENNGVLEKTVTYLKEDDSSYTSADFVNVFVKGRFTFYAVRSEKKSQSVNDAKFGIYGIRETDHSSSAYKSVANALSKGTINYDNLTRIAAYTSESNGRVVFENLTPNTFYVIRQESPAPKGYQMSKNPIIIHTVYSNGKFGATMTSSGNGTAIRESKSGLCKWLIHRVKVVINIKKSNGELLAGAKLRLIDTSTGNPVEAWTSKSTSGHEIVVKLQTGRSYRVVETAAPKGFQKASDTNFMVKAHPVANEDYVQTINIVHKAAVTVKSVKFGKSAYTVKKGKKLQLKAVITPSNATNRKITWKSGNTKIVKVSSTGKITGIKKGTTTVTATASNGKKATCRVTVS